MGRAGSLGRVGPQGRQGNVEPRGDTGAGKNAKETRREGRAGQLQAQNLRTTEAQTPWAFQDPARPSDPAHVRHYHQVTSQEVDWCCLSLMRGAK